MLGDLVLGPGFVYNSPPRYVPGRRGDLRICRRTGRFTRFHDPQRNARWSNGDPVTAGELRLRLRRIQEPGHRHARLRQHPLPILNAKAINTGTCLRRSFERACESTTRRSRSRWRRRPPTSFELAHAPDRSCRCTRPPSRSTGTPSRGPDSVTNGAYTLRRLVPNNRHRSAQERNFPRAENVQIDVVNFIPFEEPRHPAVRRFVRRRVCSPCSAMPSESE